MTFGSFLACVSYGLGINPAAVRVFRNCGQKIVFHRLFDRISHGLGIDPSSFLMRSLGDVRQFSGLCFVWFGHQSCCCSSVSQLRAKDCFPSAFRSYFAWFGHLACVSYGLGFNPAAVRVFRNCGQKIVFHRLFDHISHGLGIDPASFLMRSLGDVRHFSACVSYGLGFNPAAVRVFRNCGQKIVFHRLFDRISHGLGIDPSFLRRSLGDVRHFSGLCFVWFGHQSCCCSAVSEAFLPVIPSNGFPSAFGWYFAWFGHRSF